MIASEYGDSASGGGENSLLHEKSPAKAELFRGA